MSDFSKTAFELRTLSARLRQRTDEAHGEGLRRVGFNEALDTLSLRTLAELERLEDVEPSAVIGGAIIGLRWTQGEIQRMRQETK